MSEHLQVDRDGRRQKLIVDQDAKTVYVELPSGDLRLSGCNIEAALKLPAWKPGDTPEPKPASAEPPTIHVQVSRDGVITKLQVNRAKQQVHIIQPDGTLRYSGNDVEAALKLPLFNPPEHHVALKLDFDPETAKAKSDEIADINAKLDKDKAKAKADKKDKVEADNAKADDFGSDK